MPKKRRKEDPYNGLQYFPCAARMENEMKLMIYEFGALAMAVIQHGKMLCAQTSTGEIDLHDNVTRESHVTDLRMDPEAWLTIIDRACERGFFSLTAWREQRTLVCPEITDTWGQVLQGRENGRERQKRFREKKTQNPSRVDNALVTGDSRVKRGESTKGTSSSSACTPAREAPVDNSAPLRLRLPSFDEEKSSEHLFLTRYHRDLLEKEFTPELVARELPYASAKLSKDLPKQNRAEHVTYFREWLRNAEASPSRKPKIEQQRPTPRPNAKTHVPEPETTGDPLAVLESTYKSRPEAAQRLRLGTLVASVAKSRSAS